MEDVELGQEYVDPLYKIVHYVLARPRPCYFQLFIPSSKFSYDDFEEYKNGENTIEVILHIDSKKIIFEKESKKKKEETETDLANGKSQRDTVLQAIAEGEFKYQKKDITVEVMFIEEYISNEEAQRTATAKTIELHRVLQKYTLHGNKLGVGSACTKEPGFQQLLSSASINISMISKHIYDRKCLILLETLIVLSITSIVLLLLMYGGAI